MKKLHILLCFLLSMSLAYSQSRHVSSGGETASSLGPKPPTSNYYVLPAITVGYNPGKLNKDEEEPGVKSGWSSVMSSTSVDSWSPAQIIPFSFQFNREPVSSYIVSNTGVLTFSTSSTFVPSSQNGVLPSLVVPDNSICVWGLNISGSNDNILSKTFGTAPNRQHWILYSSASEMGISTGYTYWSIVLEETTNNIYIVDQRTEAPGSANVSLTVGVQIDAIAATLDLSSPFTQSYSNNSPTPSDNSFYEFIDGVQPAHDMSAISNNITSGMASGIVQTGKPVNISAVFRSRGSKTVTGLDINYSINGGVPVTAALTTTMLTGEFKELQHPVPFTPSTDGRYEVKLWTDNVNRSSDDYNTNDTITFVVNAIANIPERKVVIEERTGNWCGWCPAGIVGMEHMSSTHSGDAITIAVHNRDPMVVDDYDGPIRKFDPSDPGNPNPSIGFPSSLVDRVLDPYPSKNRLEDAYRQRKAITPVAKVAILKADHNKANNTVEVDIEAGFVADESGVDYRLVAVLIENGVTGISRRYDHSNYFSHQANNTPLVGAGKDWQKEPSTIPASDMVYNHVARAIAPSFSGSLGSVPPNITAGQKVSHSITINIRGITIDDWSKFNVVAMLLNGNTHEVINADQTNPPIGIAEEIERKSFRLYPNPAKNRLFVELNEFQAEATVEVYNMVGQKVMSQSYSNIRVIDMDIARFTSGVYFITVSDEENRVSSERLYIVH